MKVEVIVKENPARNGYFTKDEDGIETLVYEVTQEEMNQMFNKIYSHGKRSAKADSL